MFRSNKAILISFVVVCLVQLAIPVKIIFDWEQVMNSGNEYRFKTIPVDPYDPLRGKYISLNYKATSFMPASLEEFENAEEVYVTLATDAEGFASIGGISLYPPAGTSDYVKATISYLDFQEKRIFITYPFDRFFMEESKAYPAEIIFNQANPESQQETYALIMVKDGRGTIKDVIIDGRSISDVAAEYLRENNY